MSRVKKIGKKFLIILSVIIGLFLIYFFGREYINNYFFRLNMESFNEPPAGQKILIIAPHCDDETLGCGEFISRMIKKGSEVKLVLMTNGDGFTDAINVQYRKLFLRQSDYIKFGYLRQTETIKAMKSVGLKESDITFLGYPDGGLYYMWNYEHWNIPYARKASKINKNPYSNSFRKDGYYTGENVEEDLKKIISSYKPDIIVYPHPNDRHPDHYASYCFTKLALSELNMHIKEYCYLVHRGDWPIMFVNHQKLYLIPPPQLVNSYSTWMSCDLSKDEINEKYKMIKLYKTQMDVMSPKLMAFDRKNEIFASITNGEIKTAESSDADYKSYLLESDPVSDVLASTVLGGADLKGFYGYVSPDKNLHFFIITREKLIKDANYRLDLIMPQNGNFKRVVADVKGGKAKGNLIMGNTTETISVPYSITNNLLEIVIPYKYTGGYKNFLIGITSSVNNQKLDTMAWRNYYEK